MNISTRYLIIGGGVAGTTAAETIRGFESAASITIVSDEPYRFYSRIMLSKPTFFLGHIPFDSVWLKKESWYTENRIQLLPGKKAVTLDAKNKKISLDDTTEIFYEKLLLAIGGCARAWDVSGVEKSGIFYLRTLDDAKAIISAVRTTKKAICIGSGFVSFEMCDMLRMAGIDVTLVMREPHYWDPLLDRESGAIIEKALEKGGVRIIRNAEVASVQGDTAVDGVVLKDGSKLDSQMIIVGIGLSCPFAWISSAGVKVNRGIIANAFLETTMPDIWTAGDAAEFNDVVLREQIQLGNWINAQSHGRIAGANMVGQKKPFRLVSFYTAQGFGITIAFAGDVRPLPDRTIIVRQDAKRPSYVRFMVRNNKIIGATLINRTEELGSITKLIDKAVDISKLGQALADPAQDLKSLIQQYAKV